MTNKSNLREMGKPLAGKLMEDCVMITDETTARGVRVCVCAREKKRDKETKVQDVCIGE